MILKAVLIRLFYNGLRPFIRAQAKQKGRQKDTWDHPIKKAITAETKAALNLFLLVREMDACCLGGHCSASKPTKDYKQDQCSLPFCPQKAQTMPSHCFKQAEISERPRQDHQRGRRDRNCRNCGPCGFRPQGSTSATGVNTTKSSAQNNRGRNQPGRWEDRDLSQTIYYNYNKKAYFPNQCLNSGN